MIIAIASGKGGTGKTTVAVNMAAALIRAEFSVSLVDCDVEEPNAHIFLQPLMTSRESAFVPVPLVDDENATAAVNAARHAVSALSLPWGLKRLRSPQCAIAAADASWHARKKQLRKAVARSEPLKKGCRKALSSYMGI